jgi:5-methyltetrahydrofolate--homocysteine methyltransferase
VALLKELSAATIAGDARAVSRLTAQALEEGLAPSVILEQALTPAMDQIGKGYESGTIFVPEMLVAARAMQAGMTVLRSRFAAGEIRAQGRIVIGTVQGDLHDIGKNLVSMMLEGAGYEVLDLGVDVSAEAFVEAASEGAHVIAMSALLTTTMTAMKTTIGALGEGGLRDRVKVIVGGAPITREFATSIGADGFAADAGAAVRCVRGLLGQA